MWLLFPLFELVGTSPGCNDFSNMNSGLATSSTVRWKTLSLEHLWELRNTTASHRSNIPIGCLASRFHGQQSLETKVARLFISTRFLREKNCYFAQGQLLPRLTTCISWTVFTQHRGTTNSQAIPYTLHRLWNLSEVLFPSVFSTLSWRQWQPKITMEITALLARTQEKNLCSSQQENKTCLIY